MKIQRGSNYTLPSAPTATGVTICSGSAAILSATAPGGVYRWYDAPTAGTLLKTGAVYTTPILTTNTTYYVETSISGETSTRTAVTVTVNSSSSTTATTSVLVTSATSATVGTSITLTDSVSPSAAAGTVYFYDSGTLIGNATLSSGTAALTTSALATGSHSVYATYHCVKDGRDLRERYYIDRRENFPPDHERVPVQERMRSILMGFIAVQAVSQPEALSRMPLPTGWPTTSFSCEIRPGMASSALANGPGAIQDWA